MYQSSVGSLHVGVIMDGNGRWAEARGLSRVSGHARGARRVTEIVEACPDIGVTHLTLYAFSTENWRRPLDEIDGLMRIFRKYIVRRMDQLRDRNVRVRFIGDRVRLDTKLVQLMDALEHETEGNDGTHLTIALNYGGRDEVARATQRLAQDVADGKLDPADVDQETLPRYLDTHVLPDPDLVIRTSGEERISNFLLWQSAYAEYAFIEKLWPDFTSGDLKAIIESYSGRDRRFGAALA